MYTDQMECARYAAFVTRTIRSQSITSQLEQFKHTAGLDEPFPLVIVSIPRTCHFTSDSRFHYGWRMAGLLINYNYSVQKFERISIYDDPTNQKTSNETCSSRTHSGESLVTDILRVIFCKNHQDSPDL